MSAFISAAGAVVLAVAGMGMPFATSGPAPIVGAGDKGARYDVLGYKSTPQDAPVVRVVIRVEVTWVNGEMKVISTIEDNRFDRMVNSVGDQRMGGPVQRRALGAIQDVP
jgi:hypothetical protein